MENTCGLNFLVCYGSLLGTIIASLTALSIAIWGRYLYELFFKPEIEVIDFIKRRHSHTLEVWRLVIKNKGNTTAKKVQVDVVEVIDDKNKKRVNFLPIPLRWTHIDKENREILSGQAVYLDVLEYINQGNLSNLEHFVKFGSRYAQEIQDFCFLKAGKSKLKLKLFQENGKSTEITINIDWDGEFLFNAKVLDDK